MKNKTILFAGLGVMGYPMAGHLSKNESFNLTVFNRSREKTERWRKEYSGRIASSLEDEIPKTDVVITCLSHEKVIDELFFSSVFLEKYNTGTIFIDHSTTSSAFAKSKNKQLSQKGCFFIDAPISGGEIGAINGQLAVMLGGNKNVYQNIQNILDQYSKKHVRIGESGSGQVAKMMNQIAIGGVLGGLSEAIKMGKKVNINFDTVFSIITQGAAGSWQMSERAKTMTENSFDFGFAIDLMIKDLKICTEEAKSLNTSLEFTEQILEKYQSLSKKGCGREDTSALIKEISL